MLFLPQDFWIASCKVGFAQNELQFGITDLECLVFKWIHFLFSRHYISRNFEPYPAARIWRLSLCDLIVL